MKKQLEIVTLLKLYTQYQGRANECKDVRKCYNSVHLQQNAHRHQTEVIAETCRGMSWRNVTTWCAAQTKGKSKSKGEKLQLLAGNPIC